MTPTTMLAADDPNPLAAELAALPALSIPALRVKYAEVAGDRTQSNNKAWLLRRVAWRMQAKAFGGLSERAKSRAAELSGDAELRVRPLALPKLRDGAATRTVAVRFAVDERLPPAGSELVKAYKGRTLRVAVLTAGFEHDGVVYASLSAVAKAVTGTHVNGYQFFGLGGSR